MNGVVYAGLCARCDVSPFQGWVFGVSTSGWDIKARWTDNVSADDGAGIWQAGGGLSSDGSGSILLASGNGDSPSTCNSGKHTTGQSRQLSHPPPGSVKRRQLKAIDLFTPYDAASLDEFDALASARARSSYFRTPLAPRQSPTPAGGRKGGERLPAEPQQPWRVQARNRPGRRRTPASRSFRGGLGPPGVWPGDGGYVYVTTASGQPSGGLLDVLKSGQTSGGAPSLTHVAATSDAFGFGSGPVVVTSDGTTSGSALVWVIWAASRHGDGGQLRVYNPVPSGGTLNMIKEWSIGTASNYSTTGVGGGRLYVGTRDGKVLAFGFPVSQSLSGSGLSFPTTTIARSSTKTLTLTANGHVTVNSPISSTSSQFTVGTSTPALPATLNQGDTISVPVTFTPTATRPPVVRSTSPRAAERIVLGVRDGPAGAAEADREPAIAVVSGTVVVDTPPSRSSSTTPAPRRLRSTP